MELAFEKWSRKAVAFSLAVFRSLPSEDSKSGSDGLWVLLGISRFFHILVRSVD